MNVAQETLDFRWAGLPPALSLLMPTSAFPYAPACIATHLQPEGPACTAVAEWNAPLPSAKTLPQLRCEV
jgi:hypothetical protein